MQRLYFEKIFNQRDVARYVSTDGKNDAKCHNKNRPSATTKIGQVPEQKSIKIFQRNLKQLIGKFEFHHIGIATKDISKEIKSYSMLNYSFEDEFTKDENQGVKGVFLTAKNQPRIELLENTEASTTLDYYLNNGIKMYHFGYIVNDIEKVFDIFTNKLKAKIISPLKFSTYFKKRICFLMLSNMHMVELIEE